MINQNYLNKGNLKIIKKEFHKSKMIRLDSLLKKNSYEKLKREIQQEKFVHEKIATKFSYSKCKLPTLAREVFDSPELKFIVQNIVGGRLGKINLELKKFKHKDYTIIHDSGIKQNQLEFFFFVCNLWNQKWGGNKIYIKKGKSYIFPPRENSFILIQNQRNAKDFIQYVNHLAKKNYFYIIEGVFLS